MLQVRAQSRGAGIGASARSRRPAGTGECPGESFAFAAVMHLKKSLWHTES